MPTLQDITELEGECLTSATERLPDLEGVASDLPSALSSTSVLMAGAGASGRNMALNVARLGVKEISIIDRASYKGQSLLTQNIDPSEVGASKAESTARAVARIATAIGASTRVRAYHGSFEDLAVSALDGIDVCLLAGDNRALEVEVGRRCTFTRTPLIHAAVEGRTLLAQVRHYDNEDGEGPCPGCCYGSDDWADAERGAVRGCDGSSAPPGAPTMSLSALCSLAADLAVLELVRRVAGIAPTGGDLAVEYCAYTRRSVLSPLSRNPSCRLSHVAWERVTVQGPLERYSLADLIAAAGEGDTPLEQLSLTVDERVYCERGSCGCPRQHPVRRFLQNGSSNAGDCSECAQPIRQHPFFTHREVPATHLAAQREHSLAQLGATGIEDLILNGPERHSWFRPPLAGERHDSRSF